MSRDVMASAVVTPARGAARTSVLPDRLRRPEDVRRTLRRGRSRAGEQLAVHVLVRDADGADIRSDATGDVAGDVTDQVTRLTVVASRRVGDAVRRNRAKRLLREAARTQPWCGGLDVVLVARPACASSDLHRVADELGLLAGRLGALATVAGGAPTTRDTSGRGRP